MRSQFDAFSIPIRTDKNVPTIDFKEISVIPTVLYVNIDALFSVF